MGECFDLIGTQGADQFLATKHEMLYQYELAKKFSKSHIVQVSHGNVAEAIFRKWLSSFLPKRYGVTSGYIVSQNMSFCEEKLPHYDVIIYDQMNSPILWVEENSDSSEHGKTKAIPVEYVAAVFEVKANLTSESVKSAYFKLKELLRLRKNIPETHLSGMLPKNFFSAAIFFELKHENEYKKAMYNYFVKFRELANCYGGVILNGNHHPVDDTAIIQLLLSENKIDSTIKEEPGKYHNFMLIESVSLSETQHVGANITWSKNNFSKFAFDVIALLEGRYKCNILSSCYGTYWSPRPAVKPPFITLV